MCLPTKEQALSSQLALVPILLRCIHGEIDDTVLKDQKFTDNMLLAINCTDAALARAKELLEKPAEPKRVCF